ncbi:MAG: hypothetical protein ACE5LX_05760 [Nitrospinota bacterium]
MRDQLFERFASEALIQLTEEYKKKYEPKKGDRFNIKGITYEIGPPKIQGSSIEFEISSKIPQDELPPRTDTKKYFKAIEKLILADKKKPVKVDMENIIRETREEERKERDYVKLTYRYEGAELYDEGEIMKEVEALERNPKAAEIPAVPGAHTLASRLILLSIRNSIHKGAKANVESLVKANEQVREQLRKDRGKAKR